MSYLSKEWTPKMTALIPYYKPTLFYNGMALIGFFCLSKKAFKLLAWIHRFFNLFPNDLKKKYGNGWVLITGGATGIGFNLSSQLLVNGYKVCILGKNEEEMNRSINFLEQKYPGSQLTSIVYDLNKSIYKDEDVKTLKEKLDTLGGDISILFHNAAVVHPGQFISAENQDLHEMINVNVIGMTFLTKLVADIMRNRPQRSLIVGSGDLVQDFRIPNYAVYGATKNYMECFLEMVQREHSDKIDTTFLKIGPTDTDFLDRELYVRRGFLLTNSDKRAKAILKKIGKYAVTTTTLKDELFFILYKDILCSREPAPLANLLKIKEN